VLEQPPIILQVDVGQGTQVFHAIQKRSIALVSAARRMGPFYSRQAVEIMQFLDWRHPEIGM